MGFDGLIVPDLPVCRGKEGEILPECEKYRVDLISLVAPTSHERVKLIAREAQGFLYCVSSLGVTGVRSEIHAVESRSAHQPGNPCLSLVKKPARPGSCS